METGNYDPKTFDVILLLLFRRSRVVTGDESVAFALEIRKTDEDQNNGDSENPNHIKAI